MMKMPKSIEKVHVIDYYDGYVMLVTLRLYFIATVSIEFVSIIRFDRLIVSL